MNIKLNARLSAYSKVDSITHECSIESVTEPQIDELFKDLDTPQSVTKSEIDDLFIGEDKPESVTKENIDELFTETEDPESVTKENIDELFDNQKDTITTVSFKEIDSLFS